MSTPQLVSVRRPEPSISSVFEEMYLNERLVDVTLSCYDGQLQAHRLVLAACSSYFNTLFDKLPNPFHYPVVVIKDMRIDDLRLIVDFMYRGQLTLTQERLTSLIKCAESLQINGLSSVNRLITSPVDPKDALNSSPNPRVLNARLKRAKRLQTSTANLNQHQAAFAKSYQARPDEIDDQLAPQDKFLVQSMIPGDSIDDANQYSYASADPTSTRNLNNQLNTPSPSMMQVQQISSLDQQNQQQHLSNQLQVLSHSLSANRSSLGFASNPNSQHGSQLTPQTLRGRVHPCNICYKTFREKANLKRHLQVHSLDRVIYACPDCNKTFSWKDNYIRHTKTAHHMTTARPPIRQQV